MEEAFAKVIERVFSNWTALRLAVEHSMGGSNSLQVAVDVAKYMKEYCVSDSRVDAENIQDAIEDLMDEEFDTVCEDESPKGTERYILIVILIFYLWDNLQNIYVCLTHFSYDCLFHCILCFSEISHILYKFVCLLRESNTAAFEMEFNKLPALQEWLTKPEQHRAILPVSYKTT